MYQLMLIAANLISRVPLGALELLSRAMARLAFDVLRLRRALVLSNLARAYGNDLSESDRRAMARSSYKHLAMTGLEFLRATRHDIAADVSLIGVEHVHRALEPGKGAFLLCLHLGNWEALGAKCSRAIAPSHVLVKKVGSDGMDQFVSKVRRDNGFLAIARKGKGDGYRAIRQALSRGELIGFIMDQSRPGEPRLPFFGAPAKTNTALASIWLRVKVPVIPAMIRRVAPGRHTAEFFPPLDLSPVAGDVATLSTAFNAAIESMIRRCPEQYLWQHDRWK